MKTIVLLIDSLKGGGAERVTLTLSNVFMEQGYKVSIIMMQDIVAFDVDPRIDLSSLDFDKGMVSALSYKRFAHRLRQRLEAIRAREGEILFVGGSLGLTHRLMHLAKLHEAYYFVHGSTSLAKVGQRSGLKRKIKIEKIRQLYNDKKIICVSQGVKDDILALGIEPESIYVIYNPFNYKEIRRLAEEKIEYVLPKERYIVHVGRFSALKRHDLLLEAFSRLTDRSLLLLLVGQGEEEGAVRALAEVLKIENRVLFAGFQSNPYPIIKNAELLVLSSDHEGLPTVLIEALALETRVVSTDCPSGPHEILWPQLKAYLTKVDDPEALSHAMALALDTPYPFSPTVLEPFDQETVALQYQRLFKSPQKRILLVIDSLRIGGAERVTLTLAQEFVRLGYGVDLITIDAETKLEVDPMVRHISINFKRCIADYVKYGQKLHSKIEVLREENGVDYDLILVHLQKAIRLMRDFKHPHIYFCIHTMVSLSSLSGRTGLRRELKRRRLQKVYKGLDLITVSEGIKKDLLEEIKVDARSIKTIYNPIDREVLFQRVQEPVAERYDGDYVIHVGRLTASKRHDRLLKVYKESNIDAKLLIVGDGEEYENIQNEIRRLGLEKRVEMCGFVSNPYALIKDAKVLLLTSDYEGFAIVLVEALMLGTPVVSSNCPSGPAEIMQGDLQQYLVDMDETEKFSKLLQDVYRDGYEISAVSLERFESRHIASEYLQLLPLKE